MTKAELQWNTVRHEDNPALDIEMLNIERTLKHLVEVINEMQETITKDNLK